MGSHSREFERDGLSISDVCLGLAVGEAKRIIAILQFECMIVRDPKTCVLKQWPVKC
jgi:hypothetical protein